MATKKRKPAITGIGRPKGIIDDIGIPIARAIVGKGSKATSKTARGVGARRTANKVTERASRADRALSSRQRKMYEDKAWKNIQYIADRSPANYMMDRRGRRAFVKAETAAAKANRMQNPAAASKKNPQFYETPREAGKAAKKEAKKTMADLRKMTPAERRKHGYVIERDLSRGFGKNARNVRFK